MRNNKHRQDGLNYSLSQDYALMRTLPQIGGTMPPTFKRTTLPEARKLLNEFCLKLDGKEASSNSSAGGRRGSYRYRAIVQCESQYDQSIDLVASARLGEAVSASIELGFQHSKKVRNARCSGRYEVSLGQLAGCIGTALVENFYESLIGGDHDIRLQEIRGKLSVAR